MPFKTLIAPRARQQINNWGLSEAIWMEVLLQLNDKLAANPQANLHSLPEVQHGMLCYFTVNDPERTDLLHEFMFQVKYVADEQHVLVLRGAYRRHAGGLPDS